MNLLFLTEYDISPMQGGTEHITLALAEGLGQKGCNCYLAYGIDSKLVPSDSFAEKLKYEKETAAESLAAFIHTKNIQAVICNLVNIHYKRWLMPLMYSLCQEAGIHMYACYHAMPGEELRGNTFSFSLYKLFHGAKPVPVCKDMILGVLPERITRLLFKSYIQKRYRLMYDNCDRLVLLSSRFFEEFAELGGLRVDEKFVGMPNALTFDSFLSKQEIAFKKHDVMMLCRMDEKAKKISRALKIWKQIEERDSHADWTLTIVGGGPDLQYYKELASKLHLCRVSFEGRQEDALSYYKRASIFMMTSAYEGWGLTLTESQQMGVVPMAFASYSSLPDIITDGVNGFIIPDGRLDIYVSKLSYLMDHEKERQAIAEVAIDSCHRYELDKVCDMWLQLFAKDTSLVN